MKQLTTWSHSLLSSRKRRCLRLYYQTNKLRRKMTDVSLLTRQSWATRFERILRETFGIACSLWAQWRQWKMNGQLNVWLTSKRRGRRWGEDRKLSDSIKWCLKGGDKMDEIKVCVWAGRRPYRQAVSLNFWIYCTAHCCTSLNIMKEQLIEMYDVFVCVWWSLCGNSISTAS